MSQKASVDQFYRWTLFNVKTGITLRLKVVRHRALNWVLPYYFLDCRAWRDCPLYVVNFLPHLVFSRVTFTSGEPWTVHNAFSKSNFQHTVFRLSRCQQHIIWILHFCINDRVININRIQWSWKQRCWNYFGVPKRKIAVDVCMVMIALHCRSYSILKVVFFRNWFI